MPFFYKIRPRPLPEDGGWCLLRGWKEIDARCRMKQERIAVLFTWPHSDGGSIPKKESNKLSIRF
jgi:hypothetical protein